MIADKGCGMITEPETTNASAVSKKRESWSERMPIVRTNHPIAGCCSSPFCFCEITSMTSAICFKCGEEKFSALTACKACGAIPKTDNELALSLALCAHLSTEGQLTHFSHEIKKHLRLSVPEGLLSQAGEALKDSQLMTMLGGRSQPERAASAMSSRTPSTTSRK